MFRFFRLLAYALAILCQPVVVAIAVLHVRGDRLVNNERTGDTILLKRYTPGKAKELRFLQLWSANGGIRLMLGKHVDHHPLDLPPPPDEPVVHATYSAGPRPYPTNRFDGTAHTWRGFEYFHHDYDNGSGHLRVERSVTAPTWAWAALFLLLPAHAGWRGARAVARRLRRSNRRCVNCNYDLRESPEICPECGTPAPEANRKLQNQNFKTNSNLKAQTSTGSD